MATVEVFTYGGGEYLVNVFNAVAAWVNSGGYRSLLQVVMVIAFGWLMLDLANSAEWRTWFRGLIALLLLNAVLLVPKVDVHVTDRINPSLAPAHVDNVPVGLGSIAGFSSQVGDYLVTSSELVFGLPTDLNYSKTGMVYGARLMQATLALRIHDPEFGANLDEHFRICVFYDVAIGKKSLHRLSRSDDVWAEIGPGAVGRSQKWLTRTASGVETTIITCQEAYNALNDQWLNGTNGILDRLGEILGQSLYPRLPTALAKARLFSELPGAYQYFTNTSKAAGEILRQAVLINAMSQSMHTMAGTSGVSSIDVYAATRAEHQTHNAYKAISYSAMKWVPVLRIVLEALFYALFPVLFLVFLIPKFGLHMLRGYFTGFLYLSAWGPIYVILHFFMMIGAQRAATAAAKAGEGGLSVASSVGIAGVMDDVSVLAGYLIASVPFIAAGMVKGAMAIAGHAHAYLAPSHEAASEASREATTGNLNLSNSSFDTHAYNNFQANKWSSVGDYMGGAAGVTMRQADGSTLTVHSGGEVLHTARSELPIGVNLGRAVGSEMSQAASASRARGQQISQSAAEHVRQGYQQLRDFRDQLSRGGSVENSYGVRDQESLTSAFATVQHAARLLSAQFGMSLHAAEEAAWSYYWTGQSTLGGSLGVGGGPRGSSASTGLASTVAATGRHTSSERAAADAASSKAHQFLEQYAEDHRWAELRENFKQAAVNASDGHLRSIATAMVANYEQGSNLSREAREHFEIAQRYEETTRQFSRDDVGVSENLAQPLFQFAVAEKLREPQLYEDFDPRRGEDWKVQAGPVVEQRQLMIEKFVQHYTSRVAAGITEDDIPIQAGIVGPRLGSQSGLRRKFLDDANQIDRNDLGAKPWMDGEEIQEVYKGRAGFAESGRDVVEPEIANKGTRLETATDRLGGNPMEVIKKAKRGEK